jgi:hypothetical protein
LSGHPDTSRPWPRLHLASVKAIAVDSNAFGEKATFNIGLLRRLARDAAERGIQVWLPEPVLWELAAHIADAVDVMTTTVVAQNKLLARAGLDTVALPPYPDREALIERIIEDACGIEGLIVVECSEESLREALRDQITLRPPADTVKGIKTGAADSAWIRAVREEASDPTNQSCVIVSNDKAVERAYRSWGEQPPAIFPSLFTMRERVFGFRASSSQTIMLAARVVQVLIKTGTLVGTIQPETLDVRVLLHDPDLAEGRDIVEALGEVTEIKALVAAQVRNREDDARILAWMDVLADINLGVALIDPITEELSREQIVLPDLLIRVPLLMQLGDQGDAWTELADAPWVLFSQTCWDDPEDAFSDCFISLWQTPELSAMTLSSASPGRPWTMELSDGRTLQIDRTDIDQGWRMTARVGADELVLTCRKNPRLDAVTCPWLVEVGGDSALQNHPSFAVGEFIIRKLLERAGR